MLDQFELESYGGCCKIKVSTTVRLLGSMGIIISALLILTGILVVFLPPFIFPDLSPWVPLAQVLPFISPTLSPWIFFTISGLVMVTIVLVLLVMNINLIMRNTAGSFSKVKSTIQCICKFLLSLLMICLLLVLVSLVALVVQSGGSNLQLYTLAFIVVLVWMIFLSLAMEGIRKNRKNLIKAYIIFNIVWLLVQIVLLLVLFTLLDHFTVKVGVIPGLLYSITSFIYHNVLFVVLYNIMDPDHIHQKKPEETSFLA